MDNFVTRYGIGLFHRKKCQDCVWIMDALVSAE